jgi:hypothetical protein
MAASGGVAGVAVLAALVVVVAVVLTRRRWTHHDVTAFAYLPAEQVARVLPPSTARVGLLASYDPRPRVCRNLLLYLRELCGEFDVVLLLTNARPLANARDLPPNCRVVFAPNQALDFGKWMYVLHHARLPALQRLGLFNDSAYVVRDVRPCFRQARDNGWAVWGMTASGEGAPHIQSYCVVADSAPAARHMLRFFADRTMDHTVSPFYSKAELVGEFELGLSAHLARRFPLHAHYSMADVDGVPAASAASANPSVYHWDALLAKGCPLLKKLRRRNVAGPELRARLDPAYEASIEGDIDGQTFLKYKWGRRGRYD